MTQSSYLMVFIRNLMEHSSKDVRERKKQQLESDFNQTGSVLTKCLTENLDDVNKILNVYSAVSKRICANKDAVSKMKRDLLDCKNLLSCNRDVLRRLWLDLVEQRHCIEIIDKVDRFNSAPEAISILVSARAWPEATELTLYATAIKTDVAIITTLKPVIAELSQKSRIIVDHLKMQLRALLFDKPVALVLDHHKKGLEERKSATDTRADGFIEPMSHFTSLPLSDWMTVSVDQPVADPNVCKEPQMVAASIAASQASGMRNAEKMDDYQAWIKELVAVVHCLAKLDRLPQILARWCPQSSVAERQLDYNNAYVSIFSGQVNPGEGLLSQIHRFIVLQLVDEVESRSIAQGETSSSASVRYLIMLCRFVFDALYMQARACLIAIRVMQSSDALPVKAFDHIDGLNGQYIWKCVQHEIQILLSAHLSTTKSGIRVPSSSINSEAAAQLDMNSLDLNALMGRRRHGFTITAGTNMPSLPGRSGTTSSVNPTTGPMETKPSSMESFSFSNTSHFLSVSTYMRENRLHTEFAAPSTRMEHRTITGTEFPLVCRPKASNILSVYKQLMEFIRALEYELDLCEEFFPTSPAPIVSKQRCQLRSYLNDFIRTTYLPNTHKNLMLKLQANLSGPNALYATVSQQVERSLNLNRPLLSMVLCVDECLIEVKSMILAMPEYTEDCIKLATNLLDEFSNVMWRTYRSIGEIDSSGSRVPSSEWAQDDDVSRFWKEFPAWQRLATHEARLIASNALIGSRKFRDSHFSRDPQTDAVGGAGDEDSGKQSNHITPITAVALGLYNDLDGCGNVGEAHINSRLTIPFSCAPGNKTDAEADGGSTSYRGLSGLLVEREATRLAAKETNQLMHMINNELQESQTDGTRQLPSVRNVMLIKTLGRLSESLSWLSRTILNLDTWLQSGPLTAHALRRQSMLNKNSAFANCATKMTRLSECCLLMVYLEVRIRVFNHFGSVPPNVTYFSPYDDVDVDQYVLDCLAYLQQVQDLLVHTIGRHKFRFIFDGLGDFISQLLLRLIADIDRMNQNGNRKMCRNVYRLQQALTSLTETHESDLIRVKQLFELYHLNPESFVDRLIEEGVAFEESVYRNLLELYQRSHPTHLNSRTEESLNRLASVFNGSL